MVDKGDGIGFRRDANVADPAVRIIEKLAGRKLEAMPALFLANDGEGVAIGGPVGKFDIFEDFTRGAPDEGNAGQRSRV